MKKHQVITVIAEMQDGKALSSHDQYSAFILSLIENNTNKITEKVNIDGLLMDFNYMIDQLQRASQPLVSYQEALG